MQHESDTTYGSVFQVLDELESSEVVPVGALGTMFCALDKLRASRAPAEHVNTAEQISVAMHRMELARRRRDSEAESVIREQLKSLATDWSEVCSPSPTAQSF